MVWGVSLPIRAILLYKPLIIFQWVVASFFIVFIGLALSELASAAPTSGGVCIRACLYSELNPTASSCIIGLIRSLLHAVVTFWPG